MHACKCLAESSPPEFDDTMPPANLKLNKRQKKLNILKNIPLRAPTTADAAHSVQDHRDGWGPTTAVVAPCVKNSLPDPTSGTLAQLLERAWAHCSPRCAVGRVTTSGKGAASVFTLTRLRISPPKTIGHGIEISIL